MTTPQYMRNYLRRLAICMALYMVILFAGIWLARSADDWPIWLLSVLAIVTALPIVGVFWTIFRLLAECDDEYQRLLFVKQVLIATAITLSIVTIWQFFTVYKVIETGPQWVGVIWFAMLGVAAPIVRFRS